MADYYTNFSSIIPTKTEEEREFVTALLRGQLPPDPLPEDWNDLLEYDVCCYAVEDDGTIWVYDDESGDLDRLSEIVAKWQEKFSIEEPWYIEWANTCSKPRLDAYGGGALFVHKGQIDGMSTGQWVYEKAKALKDS